MWLIDVDAVLRLHNIPGPSPEIAVLNNQDDRNTAYAIVSHRWTDSEVTHKEMARLAKMENEEREKVKQRDGYNKIIKSCELAKGVYKWLWIDTCCIDKRSSAELSEAINSMYRWYLNSQVCYAYLHDVVETTFPKQKNDKFVEFNGWPEWFTRGWTLQELIAPKEVQFFNKDWVAIGNKWSLASTLECITRIPHNILTGSLILKPRPSVAQIMSWAADRKTARVEDRAYSLLGLLGVNMPMVYGEGERAFRRLQLEIIRESDDQSIFAWDPDRRMPRYGCILADEPSYFRDCHDMERVESDQFDDELRKYIRSYNLEHPMVAVHDSDLRRDSQHLGEFVVTNAGIRIQLYLIPYRDPPSTFKAVLACRRGGTLVTIDLASSGSIFWRSFAATQPHEPRAELTLRWIYLGHSQDASETQHRITLDDRHASINGFTRCITYPREQLTHDIVTLSSRTNDLIVVVYANGDGGSSFAVGLGHYFGQGWVHVTCNDRPANDIKEHQLACLDFAKKAYDAMWNAHAAHAGSMPADQDVYRPNTFTKHAHLPQSICAATVVWGRWDKGNFMNVLVDVKQCPGCCVGPHEWMRTSNDYCLGMRRLMETGYSRDLEQKLGRQHVPSGGCHQRIMLGDYGDFHNGRFKRNGNIFQDLHAPDIGLNKIYRPVVSRVLGDENILRHMVDQGGNAVTFQNMDRGTQYLLEGLLLPNNQKLVRLLKALSTQLSDKHLVTTVVHASDFHAVGPVGDWKLRSVSEMHQFCIVASPHTWKKEPASELRREQLKDIRKHFYNLLHIARTEVLEEPAIDTQRMPAIDFFSKLFGLEKLINYVGEITFLQRLPSIMETRPRSDASTPARRQNSLRKIVLRLLYERCKVINEGQWHFEERWEIESEVKSILQTLGVGLVMLIATTFTEAHSGPQPSETDRARFDLHNNIVCMQINTYSMIQEITELQMKLDVIEDEDEQRALEEDITGKILWLCWCGIHSEVEQTLPEVVNYIQREGQMKGLSKIAMIMQGSPYPILDDNQIHLWRIFADAGASISKHQLLLYAQAAHAHEVHQQILSLLNSA